MTKPSLEEIKAKLEHSPMTIIYFTNPHCSTCWGIKDKLEHLLLDYPKINYYHLDGETYRTFASQHHVFSAPMILLFIEGKESFREGRYLRFSLLKQKLDRYYSLLLS